MSTSNQPADPRGRKIAGAWKRQNPAAGPWVDSRLTGQIGERDVSEESKDWEKKQKQSHRVRWRIKKGAEFSEARAGQSGTVDDGDEQNAERGHKEYRKRLKKPAAKNQQLAHTTFKAPRTNDATTTLQPQTSGICQTENMISCPPQDAISSTATHAPPYSPYLHNGIQHLASASHQLPPAAPAPQLPSTNAPALENLPAVYHLAELARTAPDPPGPLGCNCCVLPENMYASPAEARYFNNLAMQRRHTDARATYGGNSMWGPGEEGVPRRGNTY